MQPYIDQAEEDRERYMREVEEYQRSDKYKKYLQTIAGTMCMGLIINQNCNSSGLSVNCLHNSFQKQAQCKLQSVRGFGK